MINNRIWTFIWRKYLAPLGVSFVLSFLFIFVTRYFSIGQTWLGMLTNPAPEWYMSMYYNTVNDIAVCEDGKFPDIVMLDLKETITRKDLAHLLRFVAKCSPKAVGVDCFISPSASYDVAQTDTLIKTISQLPNTPPFVFATILNEKSIIPDSVIRYNGFVNVQDFNDYHFYRGGIPHFAYEIAKLAGYDVSKIDTSSFLVNYRYKEFDRRPIYTDFEAESTEIRDMIKDKVVIISALKNRLDMQQTPFLIDKEGEMISGSSVLAHMLSSIITASFAKKYNHKKSFHYYAHCPLWMNVLLTLFFTLLYLTLYHLVVKLSLINKWFELVKPVLLFGILVLILAISMIITAKFYYVPYVAFFVALSLFLGYAYEIFNPH